MNHEVVVNNMSYRHSMLTLAAVVAALTLAAPLPVLAQAPAAEEKHQLAPVHTGIPHDAVYAMTIDGQSGIAVGAFGLILHSTDGGASWEALPPPTPMALLGVATAGDHRIIVGQRGTVLLGKADGTWAPTDSSTEARLLNVDVNSGGLAVAVGEFGTIMRSVDGGKSWEKRPIDWVQFRDDGYEPHIYAVTVDEQGRVVLGAEFSYVIISDDGGETWRLANKGEESIFATHILPDGTGYAVGQSGLALKTTDSGETWQRLATDTDANLLGVWASKQGEVIITGIRAMLRSSDGGATFAKSNDLEVMRNWYQPIAVGEANFKSEGGAMVQQVVYVAGHNGIIARVLQ